MYDYKELVLGIAPTRRDTFPDLPDALQVKKGTPGARPPGFRLFRFFYFFSS